MQLKLIGSNTSPYVRKVRTVLAEKNAAFDYEIEDVWGAQTRMADFNPLGKVPCLIVGGAECIFDSRVITEYLDAALPGPRLIPAGLRDRAAVKTWEALADGMLDAGLAARMEATWVHRQNVERSSAWIDRQTGKIRAGLSAMSRALGDRGFCHGDCFSLADIAAGCALGYVDFRFPHIEWKDRYPNLDRLHTRLLERAPFSGTQPI